MLNTNYDDLTHILPNLGINNPDILRNSPFSQLLLQTQLLG